MECQDCIRNTIVVLEPLSDFSLLEMEESCLPVHCVLLGRDGRSIVILAACLRCVVGVLYNQEVVVSSRRGSEKW